MLTAYSKIGLSDMVYIILSLVFTKAIFLVSIQLYAKLTKKCLGKR